MAMDTIVVGVDKSEASTRTVAFALDVALRREAKVVLVHVIPWSPFSFTTQAENETRHADRQREIAAAEEQVIAPAAVMAENAGVSTTTVVQHGNPAETLIGIAKENGGDHIMVGRTGDDSVLKSAIFGSIASRIVQHAPVPVTVVP